MKFSTALIVASAVVASAQVVYNQTTNTFICPDDALNGAFCAGDSLVTNIIIRCTNGIGRPGNCNDNLAGQPPQGVNFAPCYQTSEVAGDAACSKNCIVYGASGSFPLPNCPTNSSTTSSISTSTVRPNSTTTVVPPPLTTLYPTGGSSTIPPPSSNRTTTTSPPPITTVSTLPNGSATVITLTTPPTKTPIGPPSATTTGGAQFTGAAERSAVGALIGAIGIAAVMLY